MFPLLAVYLLIWEKEIEIDEERRRNHQPIYVPMRREEQKKEGVKDRRQRWKHAYGSIRTSIEKIKGYFQIMSLYISL